MAAEKNVLGFVDAGRKIRRPPLVGMQFLHQRAVGAADVLGARPRLHAKDLIGLLFRHFAGSTPRGPAPLPHQPARVHASRAPGGQDTPSVARGFPRRSRRGKPVSVGDVERIERRAFMPAGEDASAHRAGVVIELHLDERRTHPRHLAGALLRARAEARHAPGQPAEQARGR